MKPKHSKACQENVRGRKKPTKKKKQQKETNDSPDTSHKMYARIIELSFCSTTFPSTILKQLLLAQESSADFLDWGVLEKSTD
jgi:hypothetical protein